MDSEIAGQIEEVSLSAEAGAGARRLIEGLSQAAEAIGAATSVREICQSLAGHFNALVQADRTVMYLVDHARQEIMLAVGTGQVAEANLQMTYAELSAGLSGLALRSDQPVLSLSADDGLEPEATRERRRTAGIGPLIAAPLSVKHEVIGTVTTMNRVGQRPFTRHDVDALMTLATLAATAIQNLRLFEETQAIALRNAQLYQSEQQRRRLAEALEQAGRALTSNLDLREMPARVLEQLAALVPHDRSQLLLRQDEELLIKAWRGFPAGWQGGEAHSVAIAGHDVYRRIVEEGRPILADVARVPGWAPGDGFAVEDPRQGAEDSWLGAPLIAKDRVIGLIGLCRREPAFTPEEVTLASTLAGQAAVALENARLYDETARFSEMMERVVEERVRELHEAINLLERLDKTKSKFIEVAAHELRTPLTLVKGYGDMLKAYPLAQDPEIQPLIQGVSSGSNRLNEILTSMLDVAKIDSQTLNMRRAPVKLLKVIEPIVTAFRPVLEERRLTLTVSGLDDTPLMMADTTLLHKAFWHLIINAVKYTPDGGAITIQGRVLASPPDEPVVEVVVSDTGIGIAPEHQKLIFEKFYQMGEVSLHSSGRTKFKGGGAGLGLSIVRGIVQAHDGKIWVESPGYDEARCPGSRFHVLLPLALTV